MPGVLVWASGFGAQGYAQLELRAVLGNMAWEVPLVSRIPGPRRIPVFCPT